MLKKLIVFFVILGFVGGFAGASFAQDQDQERAYGWNLMTPEERAEHQNKMRSLKNEQEREQFRIEHHKKMQERAKEKGTVLPDQPRTRKKDGTGLGKKRGGGGGRGR
ncbi:MAG: hypothetical protein OEY26_10030 [Nitrospinota bacterium]|nr:hypothetical protein [Nitrospinota bacterium]